MCLFLHHAVFLNQCVFVLGSRIGAVSGFSSGYTVWGILLQNIINQTWIIIYCESDSNLIG